MGSEWGPAFDTDTASLPVDPSLGRQPELSQPTRWGRLVRVRPVGASPDELEATMDDEGPVRDLPTVGHHVRRAVLGPPLKSTAIAQERMRKLIALPVLSADALSSVAYGGSYIVASANLGRVPGLVAAAGRITDYVLTVAVSISSGLAAMTSAIPSLHSAVVPIGARRSPTRCRRSSRWSGVTRAAPLPG